MKKILLLSIAVLIAAAGIAQVPVQKKNIKTALIQPKQEQSLTENPAIKSSPLAHNNFIPPMNPQTKGTDVVTVVSIGSSANNFTYGYNNGSTTILWYDPNVNTVIHTHRMGGPVGPPDQYSGDLAYDISTDGGMNWTNQVKVYESNISGGQYNIDAGRYPQGAIYNPDGNTDPNNAWVSFFAPTPDGTNGTWGGYAFGIGNIGDIEDTTKTYLPADLDAGFYQGIPRTYFMTQDMHSWVADASLLDSYTEYLGDIIFMNGQFNDAINDIEYEEFLAPADCDYARYLRMAFGPDNMTGYVFWNNFDGSIPEMDDWTYPLLLKTTDGGETWADELISIEVSGPDGIEAVKNYLTDEQIIELYGELVNRDEILYSTPYFNSDIAVDAWGNPHVATSVFVCANDPGFIIIEPETMAVFDIYTTNNDDETWNGVYLGSLKNYHAPYQGDENPEYNRLQVASTWDGTKLFFTWNDTRLEGVEDNTSPDIYARGFNLETNMITEGDDVAGATNVTAFSEAMWQARFHVLSTYVIENEGTYTLPMSYADLDESLDLLLPVQYKYIQDFSYTDADFTLATGNPGFPVGLVENQANKSILSISQNQPNPVKSTTQFSLTLNKAANVKVVVTSMTGQIVLEQNEGLLAAGSNTVHLDASELRSGVYFYTVYAGNSKITRKMIVE